MTQSEKPRFPGVYVATTTLFRNDGALDLDACQAHFARMAEAGVAGLVPNGSLGEYEALTEDERSAVVKAAMDSAGKLVDVVPGVSGKSAGEARRWAEHAAEFRVPGRHVPSFDLSRPHLRRGRGSLPGGGSCRPTHDRLQQLLTRRGSTSRPRC